MTRNKTKDWAAGWDMKDDGGKLVFRRGEYVVRWYEQPDDRGYLLEYHGRNIAFFKSPQDAVKLGNLHAVHMRAAQDTWDEVVRMMGHELPY